VYSVDAKLDGKVLSTNAGDVRFAVGAQYREESLVQETRAPAGSPAFEPDRDVTAGFVELNIPLLRSAEASSAATLDLALADRYERYSDFGSTNNPHVGVNWRPSRGIRVSGTWGTSFVAPQLSKLNPVLLQAAALPIFDPLIGAPTNVVFLFGGNPDLGPQEAESWTLGLDLQPQSLPGLQAHLSYYRIRYEDRIASLLDTGFSRIFTVLEDEATLGPAIVQRDPSAELVSRLQADPAYANFTGEPDPITVGAIVDTRDQNISVVNTEGIDFGLAHRADTSWGSVDTGIEGTYVLKFDNQFTSSAPETSILNTIYNPVDVKLRAHAITSWGALSVGLFVNYIDDYKNDTAPQVEDVASWTTFDATLSYDFDSKGTILSDLTFRIGCTNLADKDPPRVVNPTAASIGIYYDGANATPLGRFVYAQLSKRW
jgi:outer membrane receptor protein involved in Fe transport